MEAIALNAQERAAFGKGPSRKLRATGLIPAVIFRGSQAPVNISVSPAEIEATFRKTGDRNTMLKVDAGGETYLCLVQEVQRHPLSAELRHLDLIAVQPGKDVRVEVDVVPTGTAEGVKMGGKLGLLRRRLNVLCAPGSIPRSIDVDVTNLAIGKYIRLTDLTPPEGVRFASTTDFNIVTVVGKKTDTRGGRR